MSVARTRHVLHIVAVHTTNHPRTVALAAGALAVAALALAVRSGGLTGAALLIALIAAGTAIALWSRLREAERSHAALALTVADVTTRLDLLTITVPSEPAEQSLEIAQDMATPGPITASTDSIVEASDPEATVVSPLRAPAEPEPLQRVSRGEQVSLGGAGGGDSSATEPLPSQPDPDTAIALAEIPLIALTADLVTVVEAGPLALTTGPDNSPDATPPPIPETMPSFTLTALNGEAVTDAVLTGTPAVVVFWRPGCQHCQRLTPELVAWESLQGPRLVVFAACDGPTAFRAGLPGLVILDPGFSVGQALGAPGTPAALPLAADGRPSGLIVAGASAVTTLLLDAMRDWASVEVEPETQPTVPDVDADQDAAPPAGTEAIEPAEAPEMAPPTVMLRRVEKIPSETIEAAPDWNAESVTRRAG